MLYSDSVISLRVRAGFPNLIWSPWVIGNFGEGIILRINIIALNSKINKI